ncbi:hypothetical protein YN1_7070 [Nanoarchaeota archaeon]
MEIKKYLGIPIAGILFILTIIFPLWSPPSIIVSGPNTILNYQQWNPYIEIYISPNYPINLNINNVNKLCLITNNNQSFCSVDFYTNNYKDYNAIFFISNSNIYTFEYLELISGNRSVILPLQKEFTLNVISFSSLTNIPEAPENVTENIENILENLGIEGEIESIIPIQYINNVSIIYQQSYLLYNNNQSIENEIKNILEKILGNNTQIILQPLEIKQNIYVINITTTNNYSITFTIIKQYYIDYNNVIEYIPKLISYYYNNILFSQGILIEPINPEPILEIEPVNGVIEYIVPGNVSNYANDIGIYYFSIK